MAFCTELDGMFAEVAGTPQFVNALRVKLAADLTVTLDGAARALGVSSRTLQRRLHDGDTTFQRELEAERVRAAKRLMLETDAKLDAIARDVGCASGTHLAALFRRLENCSPREWRRTEKSR
ncbi:MAG: helix-turn-helix transcriptional regulator [Deltaproteobacteria bacterium]|nr:helix-turn-helix transcriptional regulator [Deltaproteobacteria bacterium]